MEMKSDEMKDIKITRKDFAIALALGWANVELENYKEPVRAGTPKGERIGFSKKKYHAALAMTLHPNCFNLKEIAEETKVSPSGIRVWRTDPYFLKTVENESKNFGAYLAEILVSKKNIDDQMGLIPIFTSLLLYFNEKVVSQFLVVIRKSIDVPITQTLILNGLNHARHFHSKKSQREWERRPEVLQFSKAFIRLGLEAMVQSAVLELLRGEGEILARISRVTKELTEQADILQDFIFKRIDILAEQSVDFNEDLFSSFEDLAEQKTITVTKKGGKIEIEGSVE